MKYTIYYSQIIIGSTNLEHTDKSMGIAHGIFTPTKEYENIQNIFKLFAEKKHEEYYKKRDALKLELHDENNHLIQTECIHIEDYSSLIPNDPLRVEVILEIVN